MWLMIFLGSLHILKRYSADVASAFPWIVTYGIRAGPVTLYGLRDTTPQNGP